MRDYLLSDTNDLVIKNGDFAIGDATSTNQKQLLSINKGEYKEFPVTGVGLMNFLDDENPDELIREIRREMVKDGMTVDELVINKDGSIGISAYYK